MVAMATRKRTNKTTSIRLDPDVAVKLARIAKREHRSMGAQIRAFVELGLQRYEAEREAVGAK